MTNTITKPTFRTGVMMLEDRLKHFPDAKLGHDNDGWMPLKHTFVDGAYVREIFMPKGMLVVSKIHKFKHPYFILKGKCSVLTDKGVTLIQAPHYGVTEVGTKRVLYIHEDTTWITVHVTDETDLDIIEKKIIAPTFGDVPLTNEDFEKLLKSR